MKNHLPVNWIDGMKINKNHFIYTANAQVQQQLISNSALLHFNNYGLLASGNKTNNLIYLSTDNQNFIELRLAKCDAITKNGIVIHVTQEQSESAIQLNCEIPPLTIQKNVSDIEIDEDQLIILKVDPFKRTPYGELDPEENPPRIPFTIPTFQLFLLPISQISNESIPCDVLPIGKLLSKKDNYILDENYIPPCHAVNSHSALIHCLEKIKAFLGKMELLSLTIIQKVAQKKQYNDLSNPIIKVCENILLYIPTVLDDLNQNGLTSPPTFLIAKTAGMARVIKNSLDQYVGTGKEELYIYFMERCGIEQASYEQSIADVCHIIYNHLDANASLQKISKFETETSQLFESLAALDYIGKRKDAGIFVKEQPVTVEKSGRKIGTFLAD